MKRKRTKQFDIPRWGQDFETICGNLCSILANPRKLWSPILAINDERKNPSVKEQLVCNVTSKTMITPCVPDFQILLGVLVIHKYSFH